MRVNQEALRRCRIEAGFSLRGLATAAGVAWDTPMLIEAGRQMPRPATLKKIADALGANASKGARDAEEFRLRGPRGAHRRRQAKATKESIWQNWLASKERARGLEHA